MSSRRSEGLETFAPADNLAIFILYPPVEEISGTAINLDVSHTTPREALPHRITAYSDTHLFPDGASCGLFCEP